VDNNAFEKRMRQMEYFHSLRLLPGAWVVIRVDGRGFSRFTQSRFEKPFDLEFHNLMVQTASALLGELHGIYAYTESDEISVLFHPNWDLFDRSLEKVISISASIASSTFTHAYGASGWV
jgi:tRNA(His) guanylyltransferase